MYSMYSRHQRRRGIGLTAAGRIAELHPPRAAVMPVPGLLLNHMPPSRRFLC